MRFLALPVLVALALATSACGPTASSVPTNTGSTSSRPIAASPGSTETAGPPKPSDAPVPESLDFTAPLLSGGTFRGADYAGRDVAFWFWAPW